MLRRAFDLFGLVTTTHAYYFNGDLSVWEKLDRSRNSNLGVNY